MRHAGEPRARLTRLPARATPRMSLPAELSRHVRATALRIRLQRGMSATVVLSIAGLGLAALVVALMKTDALGEARAIPWLAAAAALPLLGAIAGLVLPVRPL